MNWLRRLQLLADKLVGFALLAGGALVVAWITSPLPQWAADNAIAPEEGATLVQAAQAYTQAGAYAHLLNAYMPAEFPNRNLYLGGGIAAAVIGLLIFMPRIPKTVSKILRLGAADGKVEVDLMTVQEALNKVVNDLPEVKRIKITVIPSRDKKHFALESNVILLKNDDRTAKDLTNYVQRIMVNTAKNLVGTDDDIPVRMFVRGVVRGKDLNMIDIASRPALGTSTIARDQIEDKWSQNQTAEPSYIDDTVADGIDPEEDDVPTEEPAAEETPVPDPVPEPEPEPKVAYNEAPDEERDPADSIDNILMVDGSDYDVPSVNPVLDEDEEDEAKQENA